jgi:hypothetical protein
MYTVQMGSDAVMYIPSFIKIGSGIQKLMGGGAIHRNRYHGDPISPLSFVQTKESRLQIESAFLVGVRLKLNPFNLNYVGGQKLLLHCILCKYHAWHITLAQMYIEHHFASIRTSHSACICIA